MGKKGDKGESGREYCQIVFPIIVILATFVGKKIEKSNKL
jgi:hypothetical protein